MGSGYTVASVRRKIAEARSAGGMSVGLPKATVDCALLESLCQLAENAETSLAELEKPCTWTRLDGYHDNYSASCGYGVSYGEGGPRENGTNYCPRCGGLVKVARQS
jgi:hypothetical protein